MERHVSDEPAERLGRQSRAIEGRFQKTFPHFRRHTDPHARRARAVPLLPDRGRHESRPPRMVACMVEAEGGQVAPPHKNVYITHSEYGDKGSSLILRPKLTFPDPPKTILPLYHSATLSRTDDLLKSHVRDRFSHPKSRVFHKMASP